VSNFLETQKTKIYTIIKQNIMTKSKFFALYISNLKLDNLAGLCTETVDIARSIINTLEQPLLATIFATLDANLAEFVALMNKSRTSPLTAELKDLDGQRDADMLELKQTLTINEKSRNPDKAAAAAMLMPVFKPYWHIRKEPMASQTAQLAVLGGRIAGIGDYLVALTTLDLMDTWLHLGTANASFKQLYEQRLDVETTAATPAATSMKNTVVSDYESFCTVLEQAVTAQPSPALQHLFDEMNELRKKYAPHHRLTLDAEHTTAEPIPTQSYFGGKPVTPLPRVFYQTDTETIELKFTVDYEVSYKNNTEVGEATMTLHGKGHYTGQYVTTFHIARTSPPALSFGGCVKTE
jgi:hypothetical protein